MEKSQKGLQAKKKKKINEEAVVYVGKEKCRVERRERIYGRGSWCEVFL